MRTSRYPTLSPAVHDLSAAPFLSDLTGPPREHIRNLILSRKCLKHVAALPKTGLAVRAFFNGRLVTFALMPSDRVEDAGRLADMIQIFFEKYRLRDRQLDFNTTRAQAEDDLASHKVMRDILVRFEAELVNLNILPTAEQLRMQKALDGKPRVTSSLRAEIKALREQVGRMEKVQNEIWNNLFKQ